jgi:hypothetical protein
LQLQIPLAPSRAKEVDQVAATLAAAVYAGLETSRVPRDLPDADYLRAIHRNVAAVCTIFALVRAELRDEEGGVPANDG